MFVLDTNVVSELRRPEKANQGLVRWAASVPVSQFFISTVTVFEIERGTLSIERGDTAQGRILRRWIDEQIMPRFEGRILPFDTAVAQRCARLHIPDPRSERDAIIAATALVHSMTIVTRNIADFKAMDVPLFNPWQ